MTYSLNVLWATGRDYKIDWEITWICELLKSIDIPYVIENVRSMNHIVSNALIVVNHNIPYVEYLYQYEQKGIPFGLIHLSDEYMKDSIIPYNFNTCQFVFRNYYYEALENHPKVIHFALGYKYNFWNDYKGISPEQITYNHRDYTWSFAGGMRDNRKHAISLFTKEIESHCVVIEKGNSFNDRQTGLDTNEYRSLMLNSKCVLAPIGNWSIDSFRLYEAFECGAIPVTLKNNDTHICKPSYWEKLLNELPPFIMEDTWEKNISVVKMLLEQPETYELKRKACIDFWKRYKLRLSHLFKEKILDTLLR